MNIIQVCPYDLSIPGGVQTHVTHLSNELVRRNHKVLVFAPSLTKSGFERKFDCEVKYITNAKRIRLWGTSIDLSFLSASEKDNVIELFRAFEPDVIHFHTIWNPVMQTQLLRMVPEGVKKVGTFHDTPPDFGIGKYIGANLMKLASGYYHPRVDEIISVSKTQAIAMNIDLENPPKKFRVLPNGIHSDLGKRIHIAPKKGNEFSIIFIGRFENRKGVFELLEVYRKLSAVHLNKKITLKMLGDGPELQKASEFVAEHSLTGVSFLNNTSDEEKSQLLADSDLLVAPSLYGESFGIVLLEAMALGVKVAGYGNAGYLNIGAEYGKENFPSPGDRKALYDLIKTHIIEPEKTDHLIDKGLEIAKKHDWQYITSEIESIYGRKINAS